MKKHRLFLLRGLVREKAHWGHFAQTLQAKLPDWEFHFLEIPGVGEFHHLTSPSHLSEMVEFMRERNKHLFTPDSECMILALSMGGMIARCWMERYPDDFSRAILVNTSFRGLSPLWRRLQPSALMEFIKIFLTPNSSAREAEILKLVSNNTPAHSEHLKNWDQVQKLRPVSRKSFLNQVLAAMRYRPPLTPPKPRILILTGAQDRLCHYSCSMEIYKKWRGSIRIHPDAGHDLPIDASEWMIDKISEWIKQNRGF
jgi:pimeloyl-[acyl-carrier protein] methyl ester esterase